MKKLACALAVLLPATLLASAPHVSAASLPESASVRDALHDVRGTADLKGTIDLHRVTGWRTGPYVYGRIRATNVLPGTHEQQFVLWVKAPTGRIYLTTARDGVLQEPPTPTNGSPRCSLGSVRLGWNATADTVTFKMPVSCFKEHPNGWQVGAISSIPLSATAWDQTGGRTSKFSPTFANTP